MAKPPRLDTHRYESDAELKSLATEARRIAGDIDRYFNACNQLSPPVRAAGWPKPLADIGGHPFALRHWADILDELSTQKTSAAPG